MTRKYGCIKDRPGDHVFMALPDRSQSFPRELDLVSGMPANYDQGQTMGCTGNGAIAVVHFDRLAEGKPSWAPARKFPYYNGRKREGWQGQDNGAMICDVVDSLKTYGYCAETTCPYEDMTVAPSAAAYAEGKQNRIPGRMKLPQTEASFKSALVARHPIICGMMVYSALESVEVARSGILHLPTSKEMLMGGHCVVIIGWRYINGVLYWLVRNSWGTGWGIGGNFLVEGSYLLRADLSSDFTIIPKS